MVSTRLQSTTGGDASPEYRSTRHSHGGELAPPCASPPPPPAPPVSTTHFLDLPSECMDKIFTYLGYKKVSQLRLIEEEVYREVCKQLDRVCSAILNSNFQKLQTQMLQRFQSIKAKMPRRESARRNHPLACESDIVETLHMRLTLLQMSFGKHIERKHVCFFAGEILDEVYRILHYIRVTPKLARPYKVTDELFDLSTMAMEYFKEHIEPTLPEIAYFGTDFLEFTGNNKYLSLDSPPHGIGKGDESPTTNQSEERSPQANVNNNNVILRKRIRKLKQGMKRYNYQLSQMRKELRCCRSKVNDQHKQMMEYASRLDDYDKKTEENNRKFSTMLQELNKCKTELQYWRSKSPLTGSGSAACGGCGQVVVGGPSQGDLQALAFPEPLPGTSGTSPATAPAQLDVWPPFPQAQAGGSNASGSGSGSGSGSPGERLKRKGSATEKSSGQPPTKKRTVLKPRNKRL